MTLSPRVGGATSKPTDVSPSPAGQRYASNSCITTKMTYEFFNELIENFLQAQTAYSVANVANDPQALRKLFDALRTGGFNFTVGTVGASGTITAPTVALTGGYEITSPQNINIIIDNNNNETNRALFIFNHANSPENTLVGVSENGQVQIYSSGASGLNIIDLAATNTLARPFITFNRNATKGGPVVNMGQIGCPFDTNEIFEVRSNTNGTLLLSSNGNVDVYLDDDNNGINNFNIYNGSKANVFNVQEDGTVNILGAVNANSISVTTANATNMNILGAVNANSISVTTANATNMNIGAGVTAQGATVNGFTRAICEVNSSGGIIGQKGIASVTKTGTGTYRVVTSNAAPSPYFVRATAESGGGSAGCTKINAQTTDVRTYNTTPSLIDAGFTFEVFY